MPMTEDQEKKLNDIYTAIVGNEGMGTRGLAERVKNLEAYKKKDQEMKQKMIGGIIVGTPVAVVIWHWIVDLFTKHN